MGKGARSLMRAVWDTLAATPLTPGNAAAEVARAVGRTARGLAAAGAPGAPLLVVVHDEGERPELRAAVEDPAFGARVRAALAADPATGPGPALSFRYQPGSAARVEVRRAPTRAPAAVLQWDGGSLPLGGGRRVVRVGRGRRRGHVGTANDVALDDRQLFVSRDLLEVVCDEAQQCYLLVVYQWTRPCLELEREGRTAPLLEYRTVLRDGDLIRCYSADRSASVTVVFRLTPAGTGGAR